MTPETSLRRAWTQHLHEPAPPDEPFPGSLPRGWVLDAGLPEILAPFVGDVPRRREQLARFTGLRGAAAEALLAALPAAQLAQRHNFGPTTRSALRAASSYPDEVELAGFAIGPGRRDEGMSIPTVVVRPPRRFRIAAEAEGPQQIHPQWCECNALVDVVRTRFGLDPEHGPDEITPWGFDGEAWRLWWD
jgi:hypothetical protein